MGLGDIWGRLRDLAGQGRARLGELGDKERRMVLLILAGLGGLLVISLSTVLITALVNGGKAPASPSLEEAFKPLALPPEDLFPAGEPDFLPGVLRERERRETWSTEDGRPHWTSPKDTAGEALWRERIKTTIDDILEGVP